MEERVIKLTKLPPISASGMLLQDPSRVAVAIATALHQCGGCTLAGRGGTRDKIFTCRPGNWCSQYLTEDGLTMWSCSLETLKEVYGGVGSARL